MVKKLWHKWYFDQLHRRPDPKKRAWQDASFPKVGNKGNMESFYRSTPAPSDGSPRATLATADRSALRPGHLYLLLDDPNVHPIVLKTVLFTGARAAYASGACGFPNSSVMQAAEAAIAPKPPDRREKNGGSRTITSEAHFRDILDTALRGLSDDMQVEASLALHFMYYVGIRHGSLTRILWEDLVVVGDDTFVYSENRLNYLPPSIVAQLAVQRTIKKQRKKDSIFGAGVAVRMNKYAVLADTLPALKSMRA